MSTINGPRNVASPASPASPVREAAGPELRQKQVGAEQHADDAAASAVSSRPPSPRALCLTAGLALAAMAMLAAFANFAAIEPVHIVGDAAATALAVQANALLVRAAVLCFLAVAMLDVVVAVVLQALFAPTDAVIARMAAWFRLAYAAALVAAVGELAGAVSPAGFAGGALQSLDRFAQTWDVALALFGAHLTLLGALAFRSAFVPRWIGVLVVIAGLGYIADTVVALFIGPVEVEASMFTFVGEVVLLIWLLVLAARRRAWADHRWTRRR